MTKTKTQKPRKPKKPKGRVLLDCGDAAGCAITRTPGGYRYGSYPTFHYSTGAKHPCPTERATCPVQIVWRDGTPNLRFCRTQPRSHKRPTTAAELKSRVKAKGRVAAFPKGRRPRDPGFLVPVQSARDAQSVAQAACACWAKSPDGFYETLVKVTKSKKTGKSVRAITQVWRGSFEQCAVAAHPLGRLRRK